MESKAWSVDSRVFGSVLHSMEFVLWFESSLNPVFVDLKMLPGRRVVLVTIDQP